MSGKVVILDGCGLGDQDLAPVLAALTDVLRRDGSQIETFALREMKLAHCLGCFGCWVKTPGICAEDDAGRQIAQAIVRSDVTVLFTPVTFGGYSPDLKRMVDRFIQIASPFFRMDHGEVHHPPRYEPMPRFLMVGVQRHTNEQEAHIFRTLAGRNAINFHPPSYASEVVLVTEPADSLRARFDAFIARQDDLPFGKAAAALMPPVVSSGTLAGGSSRRVLLITGSPKTTSPSASSILGSYLLERLGEHGWECESLKLRSNLNREKGEAELLSATHRAGLVVLACPLYVDSLPYLVTKALGVIAADRRAAANPRPQRLVAIVNSGFPETHQNAVALAICREFAAQSSLAWDGGLALAGGGIVSGQQLTVKTAMRALDSTAAALSADCTVPEEAAAWMAKNPMPLLPDALWRRIYIRIGGRGFEQEAERNGVKKEHLRDRPYAAA
jgi:multimeric flavodoxin WrbA